MCRLSKFVRLAALPFFALPLACESSPFVRPPEEIGLWDDAAGSVAAPELAALATELWDLTLWHDPVQATYLGDPRHDGRLPDISPVGVERKRESFEELLFRADQVEPEPLNASDRITLQLMVEGLRDELAVMALGLDDWTIDPLNGPQNSLLSLASDQPFATPRAREKFVARWQAMAGLIHQTGRNLLRGKRMGRVASRHAVETVIGQLDHLLDVSAMDSPLVKPALGGGRWVPLAPNGSLSAIAYEEYGDALRAEQLSLINLHLRDGATQARGTRVLIPAAGDPLAPKERGEFLQLVLRSVEDLIYPAFADYRYLLKTEILPVARSDERPGLAALPGGDAMYRTMIRHHTSLDLTPAEIHAIGMTELERIRAETRELGARVFGTSELTEIQRRLREDPAMHFETREQIEAKAAEAMQRAQRAVPRSFGLQPRAVCKVVRVPAHEEADTTIAYYRGPSLDGTRPGRYFINTFDPTSRPRYDAEVLAFHEAVPGHHLQIAIAQELEGLPLFRRNSGSTAFVEGWALYTERLCDEMGLYSGDVDRLGMLSFDAWRACRLVVDTGVHSMGWSRARAIEFMTQNTLLATNNIENEVDRYIAWPGQALAYKLGQREILALREEARQAFGSSFSIREFHDRVLENGAVTLSVLRRAVEDWMGGGRAR